jgi:hypothetical protein
VCIYFASGPSIPTSMGLLPSLPVAYSVHEPSYTGNADNGNPVSWWIAVVSTAAVTLCCPIPRVIDLLRETKFHKAKYCRIHGALLALDPTAQPFTNEMFTPKKVGNPQTCSHHSKKQAPSWQPSKFEANTRERQHNSITNHSNPQSNRRVCPASVSHSTTRTPQQTRTRS